MWIRRPGWKDIWKGFVTGVLPSKLGEVGLCWGSWRERGELGLLGLLSEVEEEVGSISFEGDSERLRMLLITCRMERSERLVEEEGGSLLLPSESRSGDPDRDPDRAELELERPIIRTKDRSRPERDPERVVSLAGVKESWMWTRWRRRIPEERRARGGGSLRV